jgi:hypothetical protein
MNVWGIKSLEERKKEITTQAAAAAASPTDWNDATHSAAVAASTSSSFYFFIFKALTLSGARADDHLWPSCWDCIGFLRGTQQFFFFFLIFGVFFLSSSVSFQFSLKTLTLLSPGKQKEIPRPHL